MVIDKKEYDELLAAKKEVPGLKWKIDFDDKEIKRLTSELEDLKKSSLELKESGFNLEVTSERPRSTYDSNSVSVKKAIVWISSNDLGANLKFRLAKIIKSVINLDIGQEQATLNEVSRRNFSFLKHQLLLDIQGHDFSIFSNNRNYMNELIKKRFEDYETIPKR